MRVEDYPIDDSISLEDKLFGSDAENRYATKNFKVRDLLHFFNSSNNVTSIEYTYSNGSNPSINYSTPGYFFTNGNIIEPSQITSFIVNKINKYDQNSENYFQAISENKEFLSLRLQKPGNPNNFSYFKIDSFQDEGDHISIDVHLIGNSSGGILENDVSYSFNVDVSEETITSITKEAGKIIYTNEKGEHFPFGKEDLDLGEVDNTSDLDKPISNAVREALTVDNLAEELENQTEF